MPIYEYECGKCAHRFDLRRRFGEDGGATCPLCNSQAQRIFSSVPIVFKGSGFYVTDYRKDSGPSSDKSEGKTGLKAEKSDIKTTKAENKTAKASK
jgi:putative FmdB family regulatory protein